MPSFEQMKNKTWSVRFRIIENGKYINKRLSGYKTKRQAQDAYVDFITSYTPKKEINEEIKKITFEKLYYSYLSYAKNRLKESSICDMKNIYNKHIQYYFADKFAEDITKKDIFNWQNEIEKLNYSYNYKLKIRCKVSAVLDYGVKYFDLPVNVLKQVDGFKNKNIKNEMKIWSAEEFNQFIEVIDDNLYKTFFMLLYFTGCRKGEALALTWNDINIENQTLNINKNLSRKSLSNSYNITSPKNLTSNRKILIPRILINQLIRFKMDNTENNGFIFNINGNPLAETSVTRVFKKYIAMANVPDIRIHDLRHSHASFLINQGESIVMVAKRLGHANIEQTLNTYSHILPNEEQKLIDKLDAFYK